MQETIKTIEGLIQANQAIEPKQRTPFLDVALGGLRTARENLIEHAKLAAKQPAATAEQPQAALAGK